MDYRGWCAVAGAAYGVFSAIRTVNNLKEWNRALISAAEKQAAASSAASKRWFAEKQAENDRKFA